MGIRSNRPLRGNAPKDVWCAFEWWRFLTSDGIVRGSVSTLITWLAVGNNEHCGTRIHSVEYRGTHRPAETGGKQLWGLRPMSIPDGEMDHLAIPNNFPCLREKTSWLERGSTLWVKRFAIAPNWLDDRLPYLITYDLRSHKKFIWLASHTHLGKRGKKMIWFTNSPCAGERRTVWWVWHSSA